MTSFFYSNLSKDFSLILSDADDYNVIIKVGENENTKEFHAHSVILRARSPYFKGALSSTWITKKNDTIIFNKPNITPNIFDMILRYIYTGELDLIEQPGEDILKLLIASDELLLEELVEYLRNYLIEYQRNWVQKNLVLVLNTACKLTSCMILQDYCFEIICLNSELLITSDNFLSLDKHIFYDLLERENLLIKEIVAWDHLIRWGIEQTPGLESENSTYPKLTTLPPRIGKFDSKIIKPKLAKIILKWINKEDFWISRYDFNLIYRGSIDGISTESFKNKCKGQVESLVLIKVKQTNKIFGGYSSIGFNKIGDSLLRIDYNNLPFYYSSDNFIFSFENDEDTQNMKISRVINYDKAIYDYHGTGFDFGFNSLYINDYQWLKAHNSDRNYENNLNTNEVYNIEEIETFVIIKH
ncbi:BTB-domain-containing protein [Rhizophagus irregularis]|uniref:BTB-domain-containing protein n=1 Tax=Rhizophagus irregularis TaxID=588596 RepID=A0A2N0SB63_9GLOM|nr:BTB-domain-containing protein [Rhizophagus irregularis]